MENIANFSIEKPLYTWMLILACLFGGYIGIDKVGRLEDPVFPVKHALVITTYAGASAEEVEQEVTDVIEAALQELPYIKKSTSKSVPGRSEVMVEILEKYGTDDIQQIFDELRRRVIEAGARLPPGTGVPLVEDDFGDVYGILYAVSAPDYSPAEISDMSRYISTALNGVPNVAKVQTAGETREALYVEIEHNRFTRLGLPVGQLFSSITVENQITPAGSMAFDGLRLRIAPQMAFGSEQALGDMRIGGGNNDKILRLAEVARISREPVATPLQLIRHNGKPVFTVGVSISRGQNVVEVGKAVDAKMQQLLKELPLGVEVEAIYAQHIVVDEAIQTFLNNLLLSVITVVLALCIFMGWRAGVVVGAVLLLTVMGTIFLMSLLGIELQRISLGALMIAMGMLVDNGIVVAEGMVIGVRRGLSPAAAASESVGRTQYALLGATIIGIMAFGPISLSNDNAGHFLVSLFQVVAISLLLSWVLAITVVPLFGKYLLKPTTIVDEGTLYSGRFFAPYRFLLNFGLRHAWLTSIAIIIVTFACISSFQFVKKGFFPTTNTPLFYVDYWLPEGTDIHTTATDIVQLESLVAELPGVTAVSSFIGRGASRFSATISPEQPSSAYAQMIVRVDDIKQMNAIMSQAGKQLRGLSPDADIQVSRAEFSPSGNSKIEARFLGPDAGVLRDLAEQAQQVFLQHNLRDRKIDWRQPVLQLVPKFDESRARLAGITRTDLSQALAYATFGVQVGLFRDDNKLLPIIARAPANERDDIESLMERLVWSPDQQRHVPLSTIISSMELQTTNAIINRRDRVREIEALANPPFGHNTARTFEKIRGEVEAIPLPPGYVLVWGGEYEGAQRSNKSFASKIPLALGSMFLVTILMFGRLRQPIIIWLTVPMTVCGIVLGLLATNLSFTFPSFLGMLSLSGMLIKNCIVLVDEIDKRFDEQGYTLQVMLEASISRMRPVLLAAGTTIAGMSPLLGDAFFLEMAVSIMGGLAFATLITLLAVPVFYRVALGKQISS
ncbi:MAG: efflux RND transporter permease subunit [Pseudomonadales bacterium]|nr:efflux RND transporter permease subunit [Pseudomonadales bacterium]